MTRIEPFNKAAAMEAGKNQSVKIFTRDGRAARCSSSYPLWQMMQGGMRESFHGYMRDGLTERIYQMKIVILHCMILSKQIKRLNQDSVTPMKRQKSRSFNKIK